MHRIRLGRRRSIASLALGAAVLAALPLLAAAQVYGESGPLSTGGSDNAITAEVRARIAADRQIGAANIAVSTQDGMVVLSGVVPDTRSKISATADARSVAGVKGVNASELSAAQ